MKNLIDYYESILDLDDNIEKTKKDLDIFNRVNNFYDHMIEYIDKKYHWDCEETQNKPSVKNLRLRSRSPFPWKLTYHAAVNLQEHKKVSKDIYDEVNKYIKDNNLTDVLWVDKIVDFTYFVVYCKVHDPKYKDNVRIMCYFHPRSEYENSLTLYYDSKKF